MTAPSTAELRAMLERFAAEQDPYEALRVIRAAITGLPALLDRIDQLEQVVKQIADQDEHEIALDPDWPRRIARAARTTQGSSHE